MKGKNLKERGITLIALVITIIVLLILAGVTISVVLHTGIIDNSQKAVDQYAYEQQREQDLMANITNYLNNYTHRVPIYTAEQLKEIGSGNKIKIDEEKIECEFTKSANYVLMVDIDLNQGKYTTTDEEGITFNPDAVEWTPIGTEDAPFKGTFNGNGHTISGIYINKQNEDNQGLFGVIEDSTIENLTVSGSITGKANLGGIAAIVNGKTKISNCNNICNIMGNSCLGGIIGKTGENPNIIIYKCSNKGDLNGKGEDNENWCTIGGIAGFMANTTISYCYNEGNVNGNKIEVGGIIGNIYNSTMQYCYNNENITGKTDRVGGIAGGASNAVINSCYNSKSIISEGRAVGGIIGDGTRNIIVQSCYNTGDITGNNQVAGISGTLGYISTDAEKTYIKNSYNIGNIKSDNSSGGIIGGLYNERNAENCYYLTGTATGGIQGQDVEGQAESKTEEDMKNTTDKSFVDILNNGENNWKADTENKNKGYPILSWQE